MLIPAFLTADRTAAQTAEVAIMVILPGIGHTGAPM